MEIPKIDFQQQDTEGESFTNSLISRTKKSPFLMAGIVSCLGVCGVGAYKWRTRKIAPQLFLIQLRVAAQGAAIACITCGMVYQMFKDFVFDKKKPQ